MPLTPEQIEKLPPEAQEILREARRAGLIAMRLQEAPDPDTRRMCRLCVMLVAEIERREKTELRESAALSTLEQATDCYLIWRETAEKAEAELAKERADRERERTLLCQEADGYRVKLAALSKEAEHEPG